MAEVLPGCLGLGNRLGGVLRLGARGRWFGALSLFGRGAFASSVSEAYETGSALAAVAWLALLADRETAALRVALASRDVIGQAKGILMERFRNLFRGGVPDAGPLVAEQQCQVASNGCAACPVGRAAADGGARRASGSFIGFT